VHCRVAVGGDYNFLQPCLYGTRLHGCEASVALQACRLTHMTRHDIGYLWGEGGGFINRRNTIPWRLTLGPAGSHVYKWQAHRYFMGRLPLHGYYLWRHVLSTASLFILYCSGKIFKYYLTLSPAVLPGQRRQPIQMGHSLHIREKGGDGLYILYTVYIDTLLMCMGIGQAVLAGTRKDIFILLEYFHEMALVRIGSEVVPIKLKY
jgi:hypothetical protein